MAAHATAKGAATAGRVARTGAAVTGRGVSMGFAGRSGLVTRPLYQAAGADQARGAAAPVLLVSA